MCGICGKYYFGNRKVEGGPLAEMVRSLRNRGPDEQKVYLKDNAGLGVSRLSIIDTAGGSQPVCNEDGSVVAVFNGEIFNYHPIRDLLAHKGHILRSRCDSELIPHLYEEFGPAFLQKLEGMFALAVLDSGNKHLLLARDRMGIKPLYFYQSDACLCFASSVSALTLDPDVETDIDFRAVNCYFTFNYFPQGFTPFRHIRQVPAGCYASCAEGVSWERYWQYSCAGSGENDGQDGFSGLFESVVKEHLRSDVPVGLLLSGGMDSSSLAYYARKFNPEISAFTAGFAEATFDERKFAARVSSCLGITHHHMVIAGDIADKFKKSIEAQDIPLGEPSFLPTLELCGFAKEKVGVVLSGEGADELFGGYETYRADVLSSLMKSLPVVLRRDIFGGLLRFMPYNDEFMGLRFKGELFLNGLNRAANAHFCWREIFSEEEKKGLYPGEFYAQMKEEHLREPYRMFLKAFDACGSSSDMEKAMYYDVTCWLPGSILHRLDTASMNCSLEARVPFLDPRIVEFSRGLPASRKADLFRTKIFLKSALRRSVPRFVLGRRKHGFAVPVARWLRGELKDYFLGLVGGMEAEERFFVNPDYVMRLFKEHLRRECDHSRKLWNVMVFAAWFASFRRRRSDPAGLREEVG
jgi:asparagine synthase (glutamine-hydrolysing)